MVSFEAERLEIENYLIKKGCKPGKAKNISKVMSHNSVCEIFKESRSVERKLAEFVFAVQKAELPKKPSTLKARLVAALLERGASLEEAKSIVGKTSQPILWEAETKFEEVANRFKNIIQVRRQFPTKEAQELAKKKKKHF